MSNPTASNHAERLVAKLSLPFSGINATVALLDDGNTLPFIARYRKEATGGLDEEQIAAIRDSLADMRALDERRETILNAIREQEQLTPKLETALLKAETRTALEDLYQPYKRSKKTRAEVARQRGLQPLAELILQQPVGDERPEVVAHTLLSDDVPTVEDALAGARDIVAQTISDHADVRRMAREKALRFAHLQATVAKDAEDERGTFTLYYDFRQRVDRLQPHQMLAVNRGEKQKVLRVRLEIAERDWRPAVSRYFTENRSSYYHDHFLAAVDDGATRLLLPAIERDVRRDLTERAESQAIRVFGKNLRGLLTQPPLTDHVVLAIDPGFRTGCKIAVVDKFGKLSATATIYPHAPQKRMDEAKHTLKGLAERHKVTLFVIGNGTASRESEQMVAELCRERTAQSVAPWHYLIVNEAGASVYSASAAARQEFPELDVSLRSAVSIARRVQDPLAELVKIDPKSIGVGMYQHDVEQRQLAQSLNDVVERVVNLVGVDVNTASAALLTRVAGIGPKLAESIVTYRESEGPFAQRRALLKVSGLGPKAFEQSAGFLRIRDGVQPLDAGAIHPESYDVATRILDRMAIDTSAPAEVRAAAVDKLKSQVDIKALARQLGTGVPTLTDILEQLVRSGRDPRADLPLPILRSDILSMDDLLPGLRLQGTVRNVVDFGAFVDVGVKQDGLLHRSKIPRNRTLTVGDVLEVEILNVDKERSRIGLGLPTERAEPGVDWDIA